MGVAYNPRIVTDGLVACYDVGNTRLKKNALFYKVFTTSGGNPTTKEGFDAFFSGTPQSSGIDEEREINWLVVENRPSYITATTSFAWEVTGFLFVEEPGDYVFNTRSDDGNELQINDEIVTSFYGGRGVPSTGDVSSTVTLTRGYHTFQYRMQQGAGGAGAQVRWQKPGSITYEVIPSTNFAIGLDNNVFVDLSTINNLNTGILFGGIGYNSSNGGYVTFDDVDDYIGIGKTSGDLGIYDGSYTFEAWVYPTNISAVSGDNAIFGSNQSVSRQGLHLIFRNTNIYQGHFSADYSSGTVSANQWYHIAWTYDKIPGGSTGTARIYKNGELQGNPGTINSWIGTTEIFIGRWATTNYFAGRGAQYRIYNRALTASEVLQNFNSQRVRYGI